MQHTLANQAGFKRTILHGLLLYPLGLRNISSDFVLPAVFIFFRCFPSKRRNMRLTLHPCGRQFFQLISTSFGSPLPS